MSATITSTADPQTLPGMIAHAARNKGPAIRFRRAGGWSRMSFANVHAQATSTARGLIDLGIHPGERVALLGGTTPDWTVADLGALCAGGVVVPIYQTNSPRECLHVLSDSGARAVIVEDAHQLAKVLEIRGDCPDLEHVIVIDPAVAVDGVMTLAEVRARGRDVAPDRLTAATATLAPTDAATIVYTSGTTGPPKGCVITHANILATVAMYEDQVQMDGDEQPIVFMFLPLAHVLARVVQFVALKVGAEIAFWGGDSAKLLDDLREVRPTHFPSVPRLFEKIRTVALADLEETDPIRRAIFSWALGVGARVQAAHGTSRRLGPLDRVQHAVAQRLVLGRVQALFGGRLCNALTGAAPIGRDVLEFFDACGITIHEGYGMTETCAAATLNTQAHHRFGTVGRPRAGVEIRIAQDGEILMRGANVSPGYFHDDQATRATIDDDGWLSSGDLGQIDDDGYLVITGRKKDLIITSSGKNIAPANIETMLQETRWISNAVVFGDNRPYLVALLTIDAEQADALAERAGLSGADMATLSSDPGVHEVLRESVDEVNGAFANIEQIKRFDVLEHDLTQADEELTPTLKIRRPVVTERYRERFEALYSAN